MRASTKNTMGILIDDSDTPGLAPCIQQLVTRANLMGMNVCWIQDGWDALLTLSPKNTESTPPSFIFLKPAGNRKMHLRLPKATGRSDNPQRRPLYRAAMPVKSKRGRAASERVKRILNKLGIEVLVSIGSDKTLSLALEMSRAGVPVIAIPKPWSAS